MSELRIGCSGWSYPHWIGPFYPPAVKAADRLAWYATRFDTVEINASFYRLPSDAAVAAWAEAAPAGFVFAWKASRFITHNKKLKGCKDAVELMFGRMRGLGTAFGPALIQLPPMLHRDDDRLAGFLELLPRGGRHAVEFRHPSWYEKPVFDLLAGHGVALCVSDHHDAPSPWETTANFTYVRAHGPRGTYDGRYPKSALEPLAERIRAALTDGRDVYCYFDNDVMGAAPHDAQALKALLAVA